ncbi:MAG: efflux RND transporter periplasmic adaptor subunit [Pseudomonadota bacterium]
MYRVATATTAALLIGSLTLWSTVSEAVPPQLEAARGLVRAKAEAVIGTELVASIQGLPYREGDRFTKGDPLVKFDCDRYEAELAAVHAEQRAAERKLKSNTELRRHKAIGASELEISQAKVEEIEARAAALAVRTKQCVIAAPFDGRVIKLHAHEHEMPGANSPLIKIVDDSLLEIDLIVPSRWLVWMKSGIAFKFSVDETQKTYEGVVMRIGAAVDPISQTIALKGVFRNDVEGVLPGMSGSAVFAAPGGS